jgi:SAM-dependent methyltransferase
MDTALPGTPSFSDQADADTATDDYARRFSGPVGTWFLDVQRQIVLDLLAPWAGGTVLDLGGGHAQIAGSLVEAGHQVTVAGSRETCRERLDRTLPPGSFGYRTVDLLQLPWEDRAFDVALSLRFLSHVVHWQQLLKEMSRVARHAVLLDYADLWSFNLIGGPLFQAKRSMERNTRRYHVFQRLQLEREFRRHGFGRSVARPEFCLPMVVHRGMGRVGFTRLTEGACRITGVTRLLGSPVILRVERILPGA